MNFRDAVTLLSTTTTPRGVSIATGAYLLTGEAETLGGQPMHVEWYQFMPNAPTFALGPDEYPFMPMLVEPL